MVPLLRVDQDVHEIKPRPLLIVLLMKATITINFKRRFSFARPFWERVLSDLVGLIR